MDRAANADHEFGRLLWLRAPADATVGGTADDTSIAERIRIAAAHIHAVIHLPHEAAATWFAS